MAVVVVDSHHPKMHLPREHSTVNGVDEGPPTPPLSVGPVFDPEACAQPLQPFDHDHFAKNFPDILHADNDEEVILPPSPADHDGNDYLAPRLTRNEYLRLTTLWYHTRDLVQDKELLANLQVKVELLRDFLGWDMAICGVLDQHTFRRIATSGIELATLPRRESTCSHTVQAAEAGSVFLVSDMSCDWRFKTSPHSEIGGLRSYAGTPLRCTVNGGTDTVALGSLCVASNTPNRTLTQSQRGTLVRFAEMLASEIINKSRYNRREQQQRMTDLLAKAAQGADVDGREARIMATLQDIYPHAEIQFCHQAAKQTRLSNGQIILNSDVKDGLWEDSHYIEDLIRTQNHTTMETSRTVRAILSEFLSNGETTVLVVSSSAVSQVFDDVDTWFVDRCSAAINIVRQDRSLQEARQAKERFLRGITHQLRTPIHGVLGSVDLLAEELALKDLMSDTKSAGLARAIKGRELVSDDTTTQAELTTADVLRTIQNSGRELMSTVNNILKLNKWSETADVHRVTTLQDLSTFEDSILDDSTRMVPDHEVDRLCVVFDTDLPHCSNMISMDLNLLRECLQSLLLNALQFTSRGCVVVQTTAENDGSKVFFDIFDTGKGIHDDHKKRIFEAYEKEDVHSRGVGLGLTLASKIASTVDGNVELVASKPDEGSHFRLTFDQPGLACSMTTPVVSKRPPKTRFPAFRVLPSPHSTLTVHHLKKWFERRGLQNTDGDSANLLVVTYLPVQSFFQENLKSARNYPATKICLIPKSEDAVALRQQEPDISFFTGPFTTRRLEQIMDSLNVMDVEREEVQRETQRRVPINEAVSQGVDSLPVKSMLRRTVSNGGAVIKPRAKRALSTRVPTVLLVDDNMINLRIIRMYCEKRHLPFREAVNGFEAIREYNAALEKHTRVDLILLDLQMPKCDGIEACSVIRKIEKEQNVPGAVIFIITGQDSPKDKERAFAAHADEFYVKPMSIKALDQAIGQYFETDRGAKQGKQ